MNSKLWRKGVVADFAKANDPEQLELGSLAGRGVSQEVIHEIHGFRHVLKANLVSNLDKPTAEDLVHRGVEIWMLAACLVPLRWRLRRRRRLHRAQRLHHRWRLRLIDTRLLLEVMRERARVATELLDTRLPLVKALLLCSVEVVCSFVHPESLPMQRSMDGKQASLLRLRLACGSCKLLCRISGGFVERWWLAARLLSGWRQLHLAAKLQAICRGPGFSSPSI